MKLVWVVSGITKLIGKSELRVERLCLITYEFVDSGLGAFNRAC